MSRVMIVMIKVIVTIRGEMMVGDTGGDRVMKAEILINAHVTWYTPYTLGYLLDLPGLTLHYYVYIYIYVYSSLYPSKPE